MAKCPRGPRKQRRRKPHGKAKKGSSHFSPAGDYKISHKGHTWEGHGVERRCALCGKQPKGL